MVLLRTLCLCQVVRTVGCGLACLGVSSLVGDLVDGVQQALLVAVRVQFELRAGVVTELGDGHLSDNTGTTLINNNNNNNIRVKFYTEFSLKGSSTR